MNFVMAAKLVCQGNFSLCIYVADGANTKFLYIILYFSLNPYLKKQKHKRSQWVGILGTQTFYFELGSVRSRLVFDHKSDSTWQLR